MTENVIVERDTTRAAILPDFVMVGMQQGDRYLIWGSRELTEVEVRAVIAEVQADPVWPNSLVSYKPNDRVRGYTIGGFLVGLALGVGSSYPEALEALLRLWAEQPPVLPDRTSLPEGVDRNSMCAPWSD